MKDGGDSDSENSNGGAAEGSQPKIKEKKVGIRWLATQFIVLFRKSEDQPSKEMVNFLAHCLKTSHPSIFYGLT